MGRYHISLLKLCAIVFSILFSDVVFCNDISLPGVNINFTDAEQGSAKVANAIKIILGLTVLSIAPAILIVMTSFTRIVIVLAMLRHALGMQQTPPNTVLIGLALFLTFFNMLPVMERVNIDSFQPFLNNQIDANTALDTGMKPIRDFMIRQTRESDLALMVELSKSEMPESINEVQSLHLIPAFMISELKTAFQIGFVIFLPFLIVDLVTASILMSMGMLMVPPMMISLPIKILMFALIDGWNIVVDGLMSSFK